MKPFNDISWDLFEKTGNIDSYLMYKEDQTICMEKDIEDMLEKADAGVKAYIG